MASAHTPSSGMYRHKGCTVSRRSVLFKFPSVCVTLPLNLAILQSCPLPRTHRQPPSSAAQTLRPRHVSRSLSRAPRVAHDSPARSRALTNTLEAFASLGCARSMPNMSHQTRCSAGCSRQRVQRRESTGASSTGLARQS